MTYDTSQLDRIEQEFEQAWRQGLSVELGVWLQRVKPELKSKLAERLVPVEIEFRRQRGDQINPASDYHDLGPAFVELIQKFLANNDQKALFVEQIQHFLAAHDQNALGATRSNLESDAESANDKGSPLTDDEFEIFNSKPEVLSHSKRSPVIGNYKLLQKLGEGGMGEVWMAEQERPVRRRVALKLIKAGLDNKQVIARFETERQVLAMMDHQNIAKVLDASTTSDGLPYFVMELVQGIPFNKYCDQNKLSINERLQLFIPVCNAVQHAHQKGIIHRDLKPTNVLVSLYDGKPVPKVIDFGLAKALQHTTRLTDKTLFTEFGQVVGTLQYMSPEQAEMNQLDIDTRTDIYSLGVMLYELLTGSTPIEADTLKNNAILQVLATIREQDPPRPSVRLSSSTIEAVTGISAQRDIDPAKLKTILRGDLDWIVMRALEKDRTRRYETANGFAEDISRYLAGDVVAARPPSTGYRLKKYVRKHKGLVASVASILALLVLGFIGTTLGMTRAYIAKQKLETALTEVKSERDRASAEADWSLRVASITTNPFRDNKQYEQFSAEWDARLDELRAEQGPDHPAIQQQECLQAVWGWLTAWQQLALAPKDERDQAYGKLKIWGPRVEDAYQRAATLNKLDDSLRAGLINNQIQWLMTGRGTAPDTSRAMSGRNVTPSTWQEIAPLYDELVTVFSEIYGPTSDKTLIMAAQRVWAYQSAQQTDRAFAALQEYLAFRHIGGRPTRSLDLMHEMIITAFRDRTIDAPPVFGKFMWQYYVDAMQVFGVGSAEGKMAYDQYIDWLRQARNVEFTAGNTDAEIYHWVKLASEAERGDLALITIASVKSKMSAEMAATHPHRLAVDLLYIHCLRDAKRFEDAAAECHAYIEVIEHEFGENHSAAIQGRLALASVQEADGDLETARATCLDAWKRVESLGRPAALIVSGVLTELIRLHEGLDSSPDLQAWREKLAVLPTILTGSLKNLNLEEGDVSEEPDWWWPAQSGTRIADFQWISAQGAYEGQKCAVLSTLQGASLLSDNGFRNMLQSFNAAPYRGKKIRFSAAVRVEGEATADQAQLWLRVDRPNFAKPHLFDNMSDRPIRTSDWQRYEIVGVVDKDAEHIYIGIMVFGEATAWLDDVRFEIVDE